MKRGNTRKLVAAVGAALAVAGGGAAIAATQSSPQAESQTVVNDAAKQLGVDPTKLSSALKQALSNRIDAAVTAGRLTEAQGTRLKAQIQAGTFPLFGGRGGDRDGRHRGGPGHHLTAAATYLGISKEALGTSLQGGKTLAQVAKDENKSVDGLVTALVADETKELDAALTAGKLTKAQRDSIASTLKARLTAIVNGERPQGGTQGGHEGRPDFGPGFGGHGSGGPGFGGPGGPDSSSAPDSGFDGSDDAPPAAA